MDGESIRNGLKDVFGTIDDFYQQISNTAAPLANRHGVITPATPIGSRSNPFAPTSRPRTPPSSQSARLCLQKMSELVEDSPLQPPQPASFNKELYQDPSSSVRSAPDETESSRRTKRRHRNPDSDSEFESRKRHTAEHSSKPGTSKATSEDAMKELFGDDTSKPNGCDKALSPDSGVHSNEGIDDTDISQMISVMSNLMPMLSPIMNRPQDRERQRKENSRARKDAEKRQRREAEEKERRRREEKKREEDRELERKAAEERERIEAEERLRREAEERLKKEAEEKAKREAEERQKREEKQRREEEKRQKKEEERLRKQEEKQRREEERLREEEEQKRIRAEKARLKEEKRKQELLESQQAEALSKLSGVLNLRNLSSDRLSQLLDMGKKPPKLEKLEAKGSRPSSPFVAAKEDKWKAAVKEEPPDSDGKKPMDLKLDVKLENKNVPSPRSGGAALKRDFHCAGNECVPQKPLLPTKIKDPDVNQGDAYQELARSKKRQADALDDHVKRILLYLECMIYFALAAHYFAVHERQAGRHLSILRDTNKLISTVTARFLTYEKLNPLDLHFTGRIRALSIRAQAIMSYHIFNFRMASALKTAAMIDQSDDKCHFHNGDEPMPAPSPGESLNSGSNPGSSAMVTMPMEVFNCYKNQLRQMHGLMNAHKLWNDSVSYVSKSPADTLFSNSVEQLCGALTIISPIDKMAIFVLTAASWLRAEYELELKRPQPPPPPPKAASKSH